MKHSKWWLIIIIIMCIVGIYFESPNNQNKIEKLENPTEVRVLKEDNPIVKKEINPIKTDKPLIEDEKKPGSIDAISFEVLDGGATENFLYVDLLTDETNSEKILSFVRGYEEVFKKESKTKSPIQIRLFPSEQHHKEEKPRFAYKDNILYDQGVQEVLNELETFEEDQKSFGITENCVNDTASRCIDF